MLLAVPEFLTEFTKLFNFELFNFNSVNLPVVLLGGILLFLTCKILFSFFKLISGSLFSLLSLLTVALLLSFMAFPDKVLPHLQTLSPQYLAVIALLCFIPVARASVKLVGVALPVVFWTTIWLSISSQVFLGKLPWQMEQADIYTSLNQATEIISSQIDSAKLRI